MFLKVHGLGWMRPFSAGTYSCAMDRFMTPRDIENREQLFYWFEQKWLYLLVPWYFEISSLGVTHRENFSHMGCLWERKLMFLFLLSCRYPRESQKSTGDWQLFLMRGVCEAALHSKFSAPLREVDVFLVLFALAAGPQSPWKDRMGSGPEFYLEDCQLCLANHLFVIYKKT